MNVLKQLTPAITALALSVLFFVMLLSSAADTAKLEAGSFPSAPMLANATTTSSVAITSSTQVLATTSSTTNPTGSYTRAYATVCNPSATVVYILADGDNPVDIPNGAAGTPIAAAAGYSACYEIKDENIKYSGAVQASSTNETSVTVYVTDYVY